MKGISHFAIGIAAASCFPQVVNAGASGNPFYFMLAGISGLLPDTIDFKFYRFFYQQDVRVTPDPLNPNPQNIADAIADTMSFTAGTGNPRTIKLDTIRLGPDLWQSYDIRFDVVKKEIAVKYGPVVNTNGTLVAPVTNSRKEYTAPVSCNIKLDYLATTTIDIFEGPLFKMIPGKNNSVSPLFIPWHRKWSHSFVIGLVFSLVAAVTFGTLAGLVALAAWAAHIIVDQLGFMGSNLFFPFTKSRTQGLKLIHSGDTLANLAAVWISCMVIFWNLYETASVQPDLINPIKMTFFGLLLPGGIMWIFRKKQGN